MAFALSLLLACASEPPRASDPVPAEWSSETRNAATQLAGHLEALDAPARDSLTVRVAFGAAADLDLYVSDPQLETVYYANTHARSGGRLSRDQHCKSPGGEIRIEEIVFTEPLPGRYRIGVDYAHRCTPGTGDVAFVLEIHETGARREIRGVSEPLVFLPILAEIEVRP
jgi:hypothetical protein